MKIQDIWLVLVFLVCLTENWLIVFYVGITERTEFQEVLIVSPVRPTAEKWLRTAKE